MNLASIASFGLHGEFWSCLLLRLLKLFPPWFCLMMARPITLVFYSLAKRPRTGLQANLEVLLSNSNPLTLWWAGYRVFLQFALTYMDRLWSLHLGRPIRWEFRNREQLVERLRKPGGVILFTVHAGNYDLGATCFAEHFVRQIHVVRQAELTEGLHRFRTRELNNARQTNPRLNVHYRKNEWELGLKLCSLLSSGEIVAVQGDTAPGNLTRLCVAMNNAVYSLPKGPFILAEISRVPCFPIMLIRLGTCHYCLQSGPEFYDGTPGVGHEAIASRWLAVMEPFIKQHWNQWFVFEQGVTAKQ